MTFDQYTVVLLVLRDDAPNLDDEARAQLQNAHLHHLATLHEQGHLLAAGPFLVEADEPLRGICIFGTDEEKTRDLMSHDPSVLAGRLSPKVIPWMLPGGVISFATSTFPHSVADVEEA